jgi:hypothetical protein
MGDLTDSGPVTPFYSVLTESGLPGRQQERQNPMSAVTRLLRNLLSAAAIAVAIHLLATQLVGAEPVDVGRSGTPQEERTICEQTGGVWTTEHEGSVGVCTYPSGDQLRCRFKTTHRCTWNVPLSNPGGGTSTTTNPILVARERSLSASK